MHSSATTGAIKKCNVFFSPLFFQMVSAIDEYTLYVWCEYSHNCCSDLILLFRRRHRGRHCYCCRRRCSCCCSIFVSNSRECRFACTAFKAFCVTFEMDFVRMENDGKNIYAINPSPLSCLHTNTFQLHHIIITLNGALFRQIQLATLRLAHSRAALRIFVHFSPLILIFFIVRSYVCSLVRRRLFFSHSISLCFRSLFSVLRRQSFSVTTLDLLLFCILMSLILSSCARYMWLLTV